MSSVSPRPRGFRHPAEDESLSRDTPGTFQHTADVEEESESSEDESDSSDTESGRDAQTGPATASFEELLRAQEKMGRKPRHRALQTGRTAASKIQPLEMSSKVPVPFLRKVVPGQNMMRRDPRFDDLSGEYRAEAFEKSYSFLNDIKKREKQEVEKKLKKTRDPRLQQQLEQLIHRMDQQEKATQRRVALRERERGFKKEQIELAKQGKRPYYLKKGDLRKMELAEKYQELKKKGKVEQFLSKKRKRNQIKDRRRLPNN